MLSLNIVNVATVGLISVAAWVIFQMIMAWFAPRAAA